MLITQNVICIKQIRKNEALKFLGYDCNKPSRLSSYKKSEWCMPITIPENPKGDKTEGIKITIVQKMLTETVRGIKCSKRVSKFRLYCGTYGHQKFFSPPTILEPETISESECSDMYARKAYIINGKTNATMIFNYLSTFPRSEYSTSTTRILVRLVCDDTPDVAYGLTLYVVFNLC